MNATNPSKSARSSDGFWARLRMTPLADLLHGNISGAAGPRAAIDAAGLPQEVAEAIWQQVQAGARLRPRRVALARKLIAWAQTQLAEKYTIEHVAAGISERAGLIAIRDSRQPNQPTLSLAINPRLYRILRDVAERTRGRVRQLELVHVLENRFQAELAAGTSIDEIAVQVGETAQLIPFVNQLPAKLLDYELRLPAALLQLVSRVVRRARLWPSERNDVAYELCTHFADGLSAGKSAAELERSFGSGDVAARLIRRAKIRNRPFVWQVWNRTRRATIALVVLISLLWTGLLIRFHSGKPLLSKDYLGEFDSQQNRIPLAERAWPLYRQGLAELNRLELPGGQDQQSFYEAIVTGPTDERWPDVQRFLDANREPLKIFLAATKRAEFGYQYRDLQNDDWLRATKSARLTVQLYPPGNLLVETILEHHQQMRLVQMLLSAATQEALEAYDRGRVTELLQARTALIRQLWRASDVPITDLLAIGDLRSLSRAIRQVLVQQPELLGDDALRDLAQEVAAACDGKPRLRYDGAWSMILDFLQHAYTGTAETDGRFNVAGSAAMRKFCVSQSNQWRDGAAGLWQVGVEQEHLRTLSGALISELTGSALAALVADRREMQAKMEELFNQFVIEQERPHWDRGESRYTAEIERIRNDTQLSLKFAPLLLVLVPSLGTLNQRTDPGAHAINDRDDALIAIARELYRRGQGKLPERLDELVPLYLPQIPIDPLTGEHRH